MAHGERRVFGGASFDAVHDGERYNRLKGNATTNKHKKIGEQVADWDWRRRIFRAEDQERSNDTQSQTGEEKKSVNYLNYPTRVALCFCRLCRGFRDGFCTIHYVSCAQVSRGIYSKIKL